MSVFVIGDTHLSLSVDKPMDIFSGWDNYIERLQKNWQAIVKPEDTVIIPGDISWGMSLEQSLKDFQFLENLNGKKLLFKGNHDYWWSTATKIQNFFSQNGLKTLSILHNNSAHVEGMSICGTRGWIFDSTEEQNQKIITREAGRLKLSIEHALKNQPNTLPIVFLHYPPIFGVDSSEEIIDVLKHYNIKQCYYGHIHSTACKYAFNGERDGITYRLVSADYLEFVPLRIK